jgi:predicted alpha-1,2-mannosidase
MRLLLRFFSLVLICTSMQVGAQNLFRVSQVNPFIGTGGHGHTYPGAVVPHGMVQLSPDTRLQGWDGCSGYHYSDSFIYGFSHTHLSGTGCSDYGDVLLMPGNGKANPNNELYKSAFSHKRELASPGYYSVHLEKDDIDVELTATERVGLHRYRFNNPNQRYILLDLKHRDEVLASSLKRIDDSTYTGMRRSKAWAEDQYVFFAMRFSKPVINVTVFQDDQPVLNQSIHSGKNIKCSFQFADGTDAVETRVALSPVSEEGALNNLIQEASYHLSFYNLKLSSALNWEKELLKVDVRSQDSNKLSIFYTALYHTAIVPNINMDVDGKYRGRDNQIHQADGFTYYSVFSLWDTYRAAHPLYTIIDQKRTLDYIKTFLVQFQQGGRLPIWELSSNETDCMIGNHSISVIADAWLKGIRGFDEKQAMEAMLNAAYWNHEGMQGYQQHGAVMVEDDHESVSKTLEYAYNDYCIARMAEQLGYRKIALQFYQRAQQYKNLFDSKTGFMRPVKNGGWLEPFEPREVNNHFTEANSWQYSFYFPQDIEGYIQMIGGLDSLEKKLDDLFNAPSTTTGREQSDITGLIGQYAHGNEPSHHIVYLYNYTRHPWKTQFYASKIMEEFYKNEPDGLIGNEDCGQMSAWYVLSAMGLYPVTPGNGLYMIGSPQLHEVVLNFESGRVMQIHVQWPLDGRRYVSKVSLGKYGIKGIKPLKSPLISHADLMNGGILLFEMSKDSTASAYKKPVREQSLQQIQASLIQTTSREDRSDSIASFARQSKESVNPIFVKNPVIDGGSMAFVGKKSVQISCDQKNTKLHYTLDGSNPSANSKPYTNAFDIDTTTTVKVIAIDPNDNCSKVVTAVFYKSLHDWEVVLNTVFEPQYAGGGAQGLVDGIRGTTNWRMGNWQGYQKTALDMVIDRRHSDSIHYVKIGVLQDTRAWIVVPKRIVVSVSEDGKTFKPAGSVSNLLPIEQLEPTRLDVLIPVQPQKVRYVRVVAEQYGNLPDWHEGAGGDTHIFVDEVGVD